MEHKKETKSAYDKYAKEFEERTKNYIENYLLNDINLFIQNLKGDKILDLGSGPGRDSLFFKTKGLHPISIDISESMVELCKQKGLEAHVMDMEDLQFENNSFDGCCVFYCFIFYVFSNCVFYNIIYNIRGGVINPHLFSLPAFFI